MFASQTDVWQINSLSQPNRNQSSYWGYLISGIEHILSGWDHLAFLLGLILLYQGRNLVIAITGFTIGHSLTLGLGAMNVLRVHSEMVEILIGFSILLLAVEKFFKHHYEFDKGIKHLIFASIALFPLAIFGVLEPLLVLRLSIISNHLFKSDASLFFSMDPLDDYCIFWINSWTWICLINCRSRHSPRSIVADNLKFQSWS